MLAALQLRSRLVASRLRFAPRGRVPLRQYLSGREAHPAETVRVSLSLFPQGTAETVCVSLGRLVGMLLIADS